MKSFVKNVSIHRENEDSSVLTCLMPLVPVSILAQIIMSNDVNTSNGTKEYNEDIIRPMCSALFCAGLEGINNFSHASLP